MAYDLGDVVNLRFLVVNSQGSSADATTVTVTVTKPDGTSTTNTVTSTSTGQYDHAYTPTQAGRHTVRWVATGTNAMAYTDAFDVNDPAADLSLVSLDDAKRYLNITSSASDEELRQFILEATDIAERLTSRQFRRVAVTERASGTGVSLSLTTQPVVSVTSVTENGTALTVDVDYVVDLMRGVLYRGTSTNARQWKPGNDNITVVYVAGEPNPSPTAQLLVKEITRHLWRTQRGASPMAMGGQDDFIPGGNNIVTYRIKELAELLTVPTVA